MKCEYCGNDYEPSTYGDYCKHCYADAPVYGVFNNCALVEGYFQKRFAEQFYEGDIVRLHDGRLGRISNFIQPGIQYESISS